MTESYIYMDYAATAWKKPQAVIRAVTEALENGSGNPGRGGHAVSLAAGRLVDEARQAAARLIGAGRNDHVIFTSSATEGLNTAIMGIAGGIAAPGRSLDGMHVICSSMEHNSVARPLEYLKSLGAEVTVIPVDIDEGVDPEMVQKAINGRTRLVVMNGVSNVTGTVNSVGEMGHICRRAGIPFLVDGSQMAGAFPVDVAAMEIDLLAFPGHKSVLGPQGTGILYIRPGIPLEPLKRGGTGSMSESLAQPELFPDRFESGTLNVPGIAGLGVAAKFIMREGVKNIGEREQKIAEYMAEELKKMDGIIVYAPRRGCRRGAVFSFNIAGQDPQDVAMILDQEFGIAVRGGLHCAPLMHQAMGTLENGGAVRVSPGYDTSWEEAETALNAIREIAGHGAACPAGQLK